jgi:hypothetical protein
MGMLRKDGLVYKIEKTELINNGLFPFPLR